GTGLLGPLYSIPVVQRNATACEGETHSENLSVNPAAGLACVRVMPDDRKEKELICFCRMEPRPASGSFL
ncbi:hypothetical protein, partial [Faecalibaculum rodentium]|uniref:hypothetical protein n=1 Tax=Faecalibaculum rodentium TaxID=1702221 RepID=UPI00258418D2